MNTCDLLRWVWGCRRQVKGADLPGHRKASSSLLAAVCVGREWTEGSLRPRMQRRGLLCPKCHIFRRFPHPCPHLPSLLPDMEFKFPVFLPAFQCFSLFPRSEQKSAGSTLWGRDGRGAGGGGVPPCPFQENRCQVSSEVLRTRALGFQADRDPPPGISPLSPGQFCIPSGPGPTCSFFPSLCRPLGVFLLPPRRLSPPSPTVAGTPHFSVPSFTPLLIQQTSQGCLFGGCQDKKAWPGLQKLTDVG